MNGDRLPIIFMELEVLNAYRGKITIGDKLLVCSWFDYTEFSFDPFVGAESVIFGIRVGDRILLPRVPRRLSENTLHDQ